jgi:hypothetical protein
VFEVSTEINLLIAQGRLLRDRQAAKISVQEWLERYVKLDTAGDLQGKGRQKEILDGLSIVLYARQFATELNPQNNSVSV